MTMLDGGAVPRKRRRRIGRSGMNRIALFLGAGASVPYGMPTTAQLREKLGQDFPRPDLMNSDQFSDAEQILQALDDETDFAKTAAGIHHCKIDAEFNNKIIHTKPAKDKLEGLVRSSYAWNPSMDSTAVDILGVLFEFVRANNGDVTVFTTNYDGAVEEYCRHANPTTECIDGFELRRTSREYVWTGNFVPSDESAHSRVLLHKLHGSMSWKWRMAGDVREAVRKPDDSIPVDRSGDVYIRPTLYVKDKDMKREPFATLLGRFDDLPESFDVCIAIGSSFRDKHILDKFIEFIKNGKVLIAISPKAASDFYMALGKPPGSIKSEWEKMHLCSMAYKQNEEDRFYAMHKRLGEDSIEVMTNTIRSILKKSASPYPIGFIVDTNT